MPSPFVRRLLVAAVSVGDLAAMSDVEEDLRTAHSDVSGDDGPPEEDVEMEIQRLFGSMIDAELRENMSTEMMLEAIEAQIDTVIRTIGSDGSADNPTDSAILARFRAKKVAVEEATCEAASLPPATAPQTPAIPVAKSFRRDASVFVFCGLVAPCAFALCLFGFSRSTLDVCGVDCPCSLQQSASTAWSFYLLLQISRCFAFGFFTDCLVREVATSCTSRSLVPTMRRKAAWVLGMLSLLFTVVTQMVVATFEPSLFVLIPLSAVQVSVPAFVYCVVQKNIAVAAPAVWLQLVPTILALVLPQYVDAPTALIMVIPILVGVIDRVLFYVLVAMMPESSTAATRTAAVFCQSFYPQLLTLVFPLALDLFEEPILVVLYAVEVCMIEFLLSTHWVDRAILAIANRIPCVRGTDGDIVFGGHDMRLMAAYTRHVTSVVGLLAMVPVVGLLSLPIKTKRGDCMGDISTGSGWWGTWGIMCCSVAVACTATAVRRRFSGAVVQPLLFSCPFWAMWVVTHLVFLSPLAFGYIPKEG
jgi:hypothetical protein